jgi:hypothetical protein
MSSPHSGILSIDWCLLTSERCGTSTGKNALEHSRDWHTELLRLCAVFERVEANVFMAVSLGQKLKNAPRLLSVFIENNIGLRTNSTSRVEVENLRSRHWKVCLNHPACLVLSCMMNRFPPDSALSNISAEERHAGENQVISHGYTVSDFEILVSDHLSS